MQVSGHISQDGIIPVSGKLRLNYSSVKGHDFVLEIVPEQDRRQRQRQSITYKAYREGKKILPLKNFENFSYSDI